MEEEKKPFWTDKKKFWVRLVTWIIFALVLPVLFIILRFDIFHKTPVIAFGFWGYFAIGIILVFIISMLKYVCRAMPFSMAAQCISGFAKIILPLGILWLVAFYLKENLSVFLQSLGVVIVLEAIAIPINPMPKWIHENLTEEQQKRVSSIIDLALEKYFSRKEKE